VATAARSSQREGAHASQHGGERALHHPPVALQQRHRGGVALRGGALGACSQQCRLL
jgi:hypothetical protein